MMKYQKQVKNISEVIDLLIYVGCQNVQVLFSVGGE